MTLASRVRRTLGLRRKYQDYVSQTLKSEKIPSRETMNRVYRHYDRITDHAPRFDDLNIYFPSQSSTYEPTNSQVCGVIIESRPHPLLEPVVHEFLNLLNIPIQIFHGPSSKETLLGGSLKAPISNGKIKLSPLLSDYLPSYAYNTVMMSEGFWEALIGRKKILIFQTDTVLCRNSDYALSDFLNFDYVGSKRDLLRPFGAEAPGGNGGLSLRDWELSMRCLERYDAEKWVAAEDAFFGFHMALLRGRVATEIESAKFASQHSYMFDSFGAHDIRCMSSESRADFLRYCPEASRMLESELMKFSV